QEAIEEKSNEITAIPKRLALLELKNGLVTLEAMGCPKPMAAQIVKPGGDYVLGLKGHQGSLHEAVVEFFQTAEENSYTGVKYEFKEEIDKGHGRLETRRYWVTEHLETLPAAHKWAGLRSMGQVERIGWQNGQETRERRYFINSISANAELFALAVREHGRVENRLHGRLDVIVREDASRIGNAPAIMTTVRHLCLGFFDFDSIPGSLAKKRRQASWNDNYRAKLVFGKKF
ncbi:MAG: ISAs1 family transposase, partial [Thioploca sp.]|nr:ISAs1 family transposase [Thioploca sp.]